MNKKVKIPLIILVVLLLLFCIAGIVIGNIFVTLALMPGSDKSSVFGASHNSMSAQDNPELQAALENEQKETEKWLDKKTLTDMSLTSRDGLRLHATRIENSEETARWAILCHGYMSSGANMTGVARHFDEMGFNVLLPDARASGESEGDYIGMGWPEREDIVDWIQLIVEENPKAEIVLYGVSMGGATVMMVSGEELPSNVKAIVEDCGYSSVWDEFSYQLKNVFGYPDFPIMYFSSLVGRFRAGYWLGEGSAVEQVAKSVTPILFIHGTDDTFVPTYMLDEVYEAASCPKEKLLVPGAGHGRASSILGPEYWERVEAFIGQYLT